jgi:hypothetical protein
LQDEALEYVDPKNNGHLHMACLGYAQSEDEAAIRERAMIRLLKLGFILDDKNAKGETCLDLAAPDVRPQIIGIVAKARCIHWFGEMK